MILIDIHAALCFISFRVQNLIDNAKIVLSSSLLLHFLFKMDFVGRGNSSRKMSNYDEFFFFKLNQYLTTNWIMKAKSQSSTNNCTAY